MVHKWDFQNQKLSHIFYEKYPKINYNNKQNKELKEKSEILNIIRMVKISVTTEIFAESTHNHQAQIILNSAKYTYDFIFAWSITSYDNTRLGLSYIIKLKKRY